MTTRTATPTETPTETPTPTVKPGNGSKPVLETQSAEAKAEHFRADLTEKATQSFGTALDTLTTFGHVSQRIGGELLGQGTFAVRESLGLSAKVTTAVLDATKDVFASSNSGADPLSGWSRVVDTSTQAYTDYATRIASSAEEAAEKIREAIRVLSDEVQANAARLSR